MVQFVAHYKVCGIVVGLALAADMIHVPLTETKSQVPTELTFVPGIQLTFETGMGLFVALYLVMLLHLTGKTVLARGMVLAVLVGVCSNCGWYQIEAQLCRIAP